MAMVLLDKPHENRLLAFQAPARIIAAQSPGEVPAALQALEKARSGGHHLAGYFAYELGYVLEPRLAPLLPKAVKTPLLWFGVFGPPEMLACRPETASRAYAGPLVHGWSEEDYAARFARTHQLIAAGDIYQANLTFRSRFAFAGDPLALWRALREKSAAAHAAYIEDGTRHILSLSPELFFEISRDGHLTARPMKGTAARGQDSQSDMAARAAHSASEKDRAENLMIVDLLRNDLGRIAEIGSVSVPELFRIETYPTLHTMVSTVTADLKPGTPIAEIVRALFPCGSVTGAPKIRAMEIIRELESSPRGVYCGAIGHFAPDGSASFNVAIRTLTIEGARGELGIGGGVVHDSRAEAEYAECLLKARYYEAARRPLELIETLRYGPGEGFTRLDLHLARMENSARAFSLKFERAKAIAALEAAVANTSGPQRVRMTLDEQGTHAVTTAPLAGTAPKEWRFAISPKRVASTDLLQRHKTNWRDLYESEHARLTANNACDEVIFLNEKGELAEGARTNIFVELGGKLTTPPLTAGVLDGCLRREMLDKDECEERTLTLDDLASASRIYLGNSLRGLIPATAAESLHSGPPFS
jgi:para-aminobenzoate synthetase/4-amino-4-deoxychorismate lyase